MSPLHICGLLGVVVLVAGCGHRPVAEASGARLLEAGSFTIQPSHRTEGDAVQTIELTFRVPASAWVCVTGKSGCATKTQFSPAPGESEAEGTVMITRHKLGLQPSKSAEFDISTVVESNGMSSTLGDRIEAPGKDSIEKHSSVLPVKGSYLVGKPLKIAEFNGTPVMLVVQATSPQTSD